MQGHGGGIRCGWAAEDRTEKTAFPMAFVGVGKARQDRVNSVGLTGLSIFCGHEVIQMLGTPGLGRLKQRTMAPWGVQDKERGGMALHWFLCG